MPIGVAGKSYGRVGEGQQKTMSGLEFVQGLVDGSLPLNTMARTLGYDIAEAESGRVVITAVPNDTHLTFRLASAAHNYAVTKRRTRRNRTPSAGNLPKSGSVARTIAGIGLRRLMMSRCPWRSC